MNQYKIFKHPSGVCEAVKQGWSWPAFFFGVVWAMVKKMWALGLGVLLAFVLLGIVSGVAAGASGSDALFNVVNLIAAIVFGMNGNQWREKNLVARGFEHMDTVTAGNPEGATALYFKAATASK